MDDIYEFIKNDSKLNYGIYDFVANRSISLKSVAKFFKSKTSFGNSRYQTISKFKNPLFKYNNYFNNSSLQNLNRYFKK